MHKEIRVLTFWALDFRLRSDEGLTLETSAFKSLYGGQVTFIIYLLIYLFTQFNYTDDQNKMNKYKNER